MKEKSASEVKLWYQTLELIRYILIGNPLKRFFTTIFFGGITLIGGEGLIYLLAESALVHVDLGADGSEQNHDADRNLLTVRNAGLLLCATGIFLHLALYAFEKFTEWKAAKRAHRNKKAQLVGKLNEIARTFSDDQIPTHSNHIKDDIDEAKKLALELKPELTEAVLSDPMFAVVAAAKIDPALSNPYLGVTAEKLMEFARRLADNSKSITAASTLSVRRLIEYSAVLAFGLVGLFFVSIAVGSFKAPMRITTLAESGETWSPGDCYRPDGCPGKKISGKIFDWLSEECPLPSFIFGDCDGIVAQYATGRRYNTYFDKQDMLWPLELAGPFRVATRDPFSIYEQLAETYPDCIVIKKTDTGLFLEVKKTEEICRNVKED